MTADEQFFLKEQFALLEPKKSGSITLENLRMVGVLFSFISEMAWLHDFIVKSFVPLILYSAGLDEKCNKCNEGFSHPWFSCLGICQHLVVHDFRWSCAFSSMYPGLNFHFMTAKSTSIQKDGFWRILCSCIERSSAGDSWSMETSRPFCIWDFWKGWKQSNCNWGACFSKLEF